MGCYGVEREPKMGKGKDQGSLGRNKCGKTEEKRDKRGWLCT